MKRRRAAPAIALLLTLGLSAGVATGQPPPGPTARLLFRVAGLPLAGPAEVVHQVNDFDPGTQTPVHTHPGLTVVSVLAGALTYRNPAGEQVFQAGGSFFEQPDVVHAARNAGTTPTRIVTSLVVSQGATLTAVQLGGPSPAPPGPTTPVLFRSDATLPVACPGRLVRPRSDPGTLARNCQKVVRDGLIGQDSAWCRASEAERVRFLAKVEELSS